MGPLLAQIDMESFETAASTLHAEGRGADVVLEILRQIDAVLYEDPADGLIKIKLVRP